MCKYLSTLLFFCCLLTSCWPSAPVQEGINNKSLEKPCLVATTKSINGCYSLGQVIKFTVVLPQGSKKIKKIQNYDVENSTDGSEVVSKDLSEGGKETNEIAVKVSGVKNKDGKCKLKANVTWEDAKGVEHTDAVACPFKIKIEGLDQLGGESFVVNTTDDTKNLENINDEKTEPDDLSEIDQDENNPNPNFNPGTIVTKPSTEDSSRPVWMNHYQRWAPFLWIKIILLFAQWR